MSGLLALVAPNGAPVDRGDATRMLARLDHRGRHGRRLLVDGPMAIGHQHHWTTPEEEGELQPLTSTERRFAVAIDGRIDNRNELGAALDLDRATVAETSDARLLLYAFERWGESCFRLLVGPFAAIVADRTTGTLICARDPLGDRSLFYGGDRRLLVVASEEQAVLAHPRLDSELDQASLAALFAVQERTLGRTFFRDVHELPQGHLLRIDRDGPHQVCYWEWQLPAVRYRSDADYGDRFLELLTESVRCRLRSTGTPAVLMSGGLDSTSVASVAARELGPGHRLAAVSWTFDELAACDERPYIGPVTARWQLAGLEVNGDDGWPFRNAHAWPHNPNRPVDNAYRILKERAYSKARLHDIDVLLTGGWGDHLYAGGSGWLEEELTAFRWWSAVRELGWLSFRGKLLADPGVRRLGRRIFRGRATAGLPPWLTPAATALLDRDRWLPPGLEGSPRPEQAAVVCGPLAADSAASETYHASHHGLELRHPFRDRRLVEFMLAIPADQLIRRGMIKHVLRVAMNGILPDEVRLRTTPTSLLPLYARGLLEREAVRVGRLVNRADATWRPFVDLAPILRTLPERLANGQDGPACLVPWHCSYLELWLQRMGRSNVVYPEAA
jgi:asparagine synthase (glutamine-hydrolysing)